MLLRAYTSIVIASLSYRIYQTTSCILQTFQLVSLHLRSSTYFNIFFPSPEFSENFPKISELLTTECTMQKKTATEVDKRAVRAGMTT